MDKSNRIDEYDAKSNNWLDSDSYRSVEKMFPKDGQPTDHQIYFDELPNFDEEEKGDIYWTFIESLKNETGKTILSILKDEKHDIDYKDRDLCIYMLVLLNKKDLYLEIKEFFEENIDLPNTSNGIIMEELPDNFNDITQEGPERNRLRENAWRRA